MAYTSSFSKTTGETIEVTDFTTEFDSIEYELSALYGVPDSTSGTITLRSDGPGSSIGGQLVFDIPPDYDTTYQEYKLYVNQDDLVISQNATPVFTINGSDSSVAIGNAIITGGSIDGVTIDGTVIGGTSPTAITGTTITANTSLTTPTVIATTLSAGSSTFTGTVKLENVSPNLIFRDTNSTYASNEYYCNIQFEASDTSYFNISKGILSDYVNINSAIGLRVDTSSSQPFEVYTDGSPALSIDSSQNATFEGEAIFKDSAKVKTYLEPVRFEYYNTTAPTYPAGMSSHTAVFIANSEFSYDNASIAIIGGVTARSQIYFGDRDADAMGAIRYNHSDNSMSLATNNTFTPPALKLDSSQNATFTGDVTCSSVFCNNVSSTGVEVVGGDISIDKTAAVENATLTLATTGSNASVITLTDGTTNVNILNDHSVDEFRITRGATTLLEFNSSNNATFSGDIIISNTKGLDFSASGGDKVTVMEVGSDSGFEWNITVTSGTNATFSSVADGFYTRVNNIVTFSARISVNVGIAGNNSTFYFSLPVSSNFTTDGDAIGSGTAVGSSSQHPVYVEADAANDRLEVRFVSSSSGSNAIILHGQYRIK